MPKDKADWASWNVAGGANKTGPSVTYWLSRLQNHSNKSIFLTLNPEHKPEGEFFRTSLDHPVMDVAAFEGQEEEAKHQGKHGVYHAGAWLRNGFHEDGTVSGLIAARRVIHTVYTLLIK
jgi:predicted NAD/FAD-binding protein